MMETNFIKKFDDDSVEVLFKEEIGFTSLIILNIFIKYN